MHYTAYLKRTREAAATVGGEFVSLAGGSYGVHLPVESNLFLILALDSDGCQGWAVWAEDAMGERCCDNGSEELGWPKLARLKQLAIEAYGRHVHS